MAIFFYANYLKLLNADREPVKWYFKLVAWTSIIRKEKNFRPHNKVKPVAAGPRSEPAILDPFAKLEERSFIYSKYWRCLISCIIIIIIIIITAQTPLPTSKHSLPSPLRGMAGKYHSSVSFNTGRWIKTLALRYCGDIRNAQLRNSTLMTSRSLGKEGMMECIDLV